MQRLLQRLALTRPCLAVGAASVVPASEPPLVGIDSRVLLVPSRAQLPVMLRLEERIDSDCAIESDTTLRLSAIVHARLERDPDAATHVAKGSSLIELLRCNGHLLDGSSGECRSSVLALRTEVERPEENVGYARILTVRATPGEAAPDGFPDGGLEFERTVEAGRCHIMGVLPVDHRPEEHATEYAAEHAGEYAPGLLLIVSKIYRIDPAD